MRMSLLLKAVQGRQMRRAGMTLMSEKYSMKRWGGQAVNGSASEGFRNEDHIENRWLGQPR